MSRIHDALKKALEERAKASSSEVLPAFAEILGPGDARETEAAPPSEYVATPPGSPPVATSGELTLQTLVAKCAQPNWSPDPRAFLLFNGQRHPLGTEEFRTLRSRLYRFRQSRPLGIVQVASAVPGEGKTFIAANLAQVIAQQHEQSTLLLDADLRWPQLHRMLGAPASPGLSDYLLGEADEISVIQRNPQANLFFIPAGKKVSNPNELIGNGRIKVLLQCLSRILPWVILDSPPAILVSDAGMLSAVCDGVLLVVQAGATRFDLAQKACQELHAASLLGVVLNRVEPSFTYNQYHHEHNDPSKGKEKPKVK